MGGLSGLRAFSNARYVSGRFSNRVCAAQEIQVNLTSCCSTFRP